jgi:tetratricopeptide (TPR) repeat protein
MRWFWVLLLVQTLSFGQKKPVARVDSTSYYIQLANFNKKTNNYKFALAFSQKAFNYAKARRNIKGKARALFSLASTYFDLKKVNDALETFSQSADFYSQIPPTTGYALCYYNMGLCLSLIHI